MEGNKLLTLLVTITVGIIFIGALLAPVIEDTSTTEKTFTNDGYYRMSKYTTENDVTLVWSYEAPNVITVNDVDYTITAPDDGNYSRTVLFGTDLGARLFYNNSGCQMMSSTGTAAADVTDSETLTVVCSGGTITATVTATGVSPTSFTGTYNDLYCISGDGDYVMKKATKSVYMNGDSEFIAFGVTSVGGAAKVLSVDGTIDDGATVTQITTTGQATYSDPTIVSTEVSGYKSLYTLDKITFTGTLNDSTTDITYSYFVVPYQVTAELSQHLDAGEIAILAAIPLMAIAVLILLVVRYFVAGRD